MAENPVAMFVALCVALFTALSLLNVAGLSTSLFSAATSGSTAQFAIATQNYFYGWIGDAISDAIISPIISLLIMLAYYLMDGLSSSPRGSGL